MKVTPQKPEKWKLILLSIVLYFEVLVLISRVRSRMALGVLPAVLLGATVIITGLLITVKPRKESKTNDDRKDSLPEGDRIIGRSRQEKGARTEEQGSRSIRTVFLFGFLFGCVLFILLYGCKVLNPNYVEWLKDGDNGQHYLGWVYYRHSDWHFPIGLYDGMNAGLTSVIMMDSIPHFALLFKLLSFLLPEIFQYFGFYGIFSFAMMGGFSSILLFRFSNKMPLSLIFSTFFICSPYVLQRMYAHTSLASQWIVVAALYLWVWKPGNGKKSNIAFWCALMTVASGTHLYFIPILMVCLLCCSIQDGMEKECIRFLLGRFILVPLVGLLTIWIYGGFSTLVMEGDTHGYYVANLNALINPQNTGIFMRALPVSPYGEQQFEGYGYLGFGIIVGIVIVFLFFSVIRNNEQKSLFSKELSVSFLLGTVVFVIISTGFNFWWGDQLVWTPRLPSLVMRLFSVFRAAGRFIWGACYLIYFTTFAGICRIANSKSLRANTLIIFLTFLQFADLGSYILRIHNTGQYQTYISRSSEFNQMAWDTILSNKKYLKYMQDVDVEEITAHRLIDTYAAERRVSSNQVRVSSRGFDEKKLQESVENIRVGLRQGNIQGDAVYIFSSDDPTFIDYPLYYYEVDQWILGVKDRIPELSAMKGVSEITFGPQKLEADESIWFSGDEWNGDRYVYSGLSFSEDSFTWSDGREIRFLPLSINPDQTGEQFHGQLVIGWIHSDVQHVRVFSNSSLVYDGILDEKTERIEFDVQEDEDGLIKLEIELPDAISPQELGTSADTRLLAIAMIRMDFEPIL